MGINACEGKTISSMKNSSMKNDEKYFSTLEEKFRISARPCDILFVCRLQTVPHFSSGIEERAKRKLT